MAAHRIPIVQGHPDPAGGHVCHALAAGDAEGAAEASHEVRGADVSRLDVPLLRKGFLEQVARNGFAVGTAGADGLGRKLLAGCSARVVATMGMPALVYRWYFLAHGVKSLERNILGFVGIAPAHRSLVGSVDTADGARRGKWLSEMPLLGERGA